MGKARILSAQGEGLYSIEILEDRTRAESRKALAEQRIADIDTKLTDLEQELSAAQQAVDDGADSQDQAIATYRAEPTDEHRQAMDEAAVALIEVARLRDAVRSQIASLNLERLTLQATIDRVDTLPPLRQQDAWCADYTEDLSGEVATAEVPGEIGQVIIKPGFDDAAAWNPSADGAIQPALAGTPAGVFYNLAMMPGWQKWRPTFRIATISNINSDLCDITLDAATSSQQGLGVNAQGSYSGVPIFYMDCNGGAFEEGDRVLVAFSGNTEQPMVIGFEKEPKECFVPFEYSSKAFSVDAYRYVLPAITLPGQTWTAPGAVWCYPPSTLDSTPVPVPESNDLRPALVSDGNYNSIDYRNNTDGSESGTIEPIQEPTQTFIAEEISFTRTLSVELIGDYLDYEYTRTDVFVCAGLNVPGIDATGFEIEFGYYRKRILYNNRVTIVDEDSNVCDLETGGPLYRVSQTFEVDRTLNGYVELRVPGYAPVRFDYSFLSTTNFTHTWVGAVAVRRGVVHITAFTSDGNVKGIFILHTGGVTKAEYNDDYWEKPNPPDEISDYNQDQSGTGLPVDVVITQDGFEYIYA